MIPLGTNRKRTRVVVLLMKGEEWPAVAGRSWNHRPTYNFSNHLSNLTTTVSREERQIYRRCGTHSSKFTFI